MSYCGDQKGSNAGDVIQHSRSSNSINNLNYDCLAKIFGYLSWEQRLEMGTVCRHWKEALKFAWDDLQTAFTFGDMSFNPDNVSGSADTLVGDDTEQLPESLRNNQGIAKILMSCGNRLNELHIGTPYSSHILPIIAQYCKNLRILELTFGSYDVKWSQFLPFLKRLESLKISNFKRKFPQKFFNILAETLVDIEIHSLRKNRFSATHGFMNLGHLRYLTLVNFSLDSNMIDAIAQKANLIHLNLSECKISNGDLTLLFRLDNLQHLNLSKISAVNDDYVIQLADNFKNLKSLDLSLCENVTDRGVMSLRRLPQLEKLNLRSCYITDGPLGEMHNLKILDCESCGNVKNSGIIRLIKNTAMLQKLNVTGCGVSEAIIVEALEVTRRRNLKLRIIVAASVVRNLDAREIYSPLLIVLLKMSSLAYMHFNLL